MHLVGGHRGMLAQPFEQRFKAFAVIAESAGLTWLRVLQQPQIYIELEFSDINSQYMSGRFHYRNGLVKRLWDRLVDEACIGSHALSAGTGYGFIFEFIENQVGSPKELSIAAAQARLDFTWFS